MTKESVTYWKLKSRLAYDNYLANTIGYRLLYWYKCFLNEKLNN